MIKEIKVRKVRQACLALPAKTANKASKERPAQMGHLEPMANLGQKERLASLDLKEQ